MDKFIVNGFTGANLAALLEESSGISMKDKPLPDKFKILTTECTYIFWANTGLVEVEENK